MTTEPCVAGHTANDGGDCQKMSLTELCDHIEATHHRYIRDEMPNLSNQVQEVAAIHAFKHLELLKVSRLFEGLRADMETHLTREEGVLFPICRKLEVVDCRLTPFRGSVANPIQHMEKVHEKAGLAVHTIRILTANYQPPNGNDSYRAMLESLRKFDDDLQEHLRKEKDILFPGALAREKQLGL
ncbi:MAG: hemerythrin domain-containing protein [Planctomycetota bacterium]